MKSKNNNFKFTQLISIENKKLTRYCITFFCAQNSLYEIEKSKILNKNFKLLKKIAFKLMITIKNEEVQTTLKEIFKENFQLEKKITK